jgi:hypothetical protein
MTFRHTSLKTAIFEHGTYLRTELRALPEKLPIVQTFRKFPAILRNPKVHHRVHKALEYGTADKKKKYWFSSSEILLIA